MESSKSDNTAPKLLLIAYYFPPIKSIGVMRNYKMARHLANRVEAIHILTTTNRHRMQQEPLPLDSFQITEVPTLDYRTLSSLRQQKNNHLPASAKNHPLARLWLRLKDSFPTNILIDEGGLLYILSGFFKARRILRQQQISLLYSSFRPYSDHLIAYLLKRFNPNLYWIADFRDLQHDPNRGNTYWPRLQHWFNRRILRHADQVMTVSEGLAKPLRKYKQEVAVIRNGVELRKEKVEPPTKFTIAYTGSIYQNFQTPELLLEVLADLVAKGQIAKDQLQIIYAGKDSSSWQTWIQNAKLEACFVDRGLLPLADALQVQQQAHLNLLLSWASPKLSGILTGKLYEYLGAQRPILLLIKGTNDEEFETLFDDLQAGLVAYHRQEYKARIAQYVLNLYQEWQQNGELKTAINSDQLAAYSWQSRADEILNFPLQ